MFLFQLWIQWLFLEAVDCWNEERSLKALGIDNMDFNTLKNFFVEG